MADEGIGLDFGTSNTVWAYARRGADALTTGGEFFAREKLGGSDAWIASMVAYQGENPYRVGAHVRAKAEELKKAGCDIVRSAKTRLRGERHLNTIPGMNPWAGDRDGDAVANIVKHALAFAAEKRPPGIQTVLTYPFRASSDYRAGLRYAAEKSGCDVAYFLCEPTAALLSFPQVRAQALERARRHCLVFDWGGGTLDVSLVRIGRGCLLEVDTKGKNLAGDQLDAIILEEMIEQGAILELRDQEIDALTIWAERIKIRLSSQTSFKGEPPVVGAREFVLTQQRFAELLGRQGSGREPSILSQLIERVHQVLGAMKPDEIDGVYLVGGSSNIPIVRQELIRIFKGRVFFHQQTDHGQSAVAEGAAAALALGGRPFLSWGLVTWTPSGEPCYLLEPGMSWDDLVSGNPVTRNFFLADLQADHVEIPIGFEVPALDGQGCEHRLLTQLRLPARGLPRSGRLWYPVQVDVQGRPDGNIVIQATIPDAGRQHERVSIDTIPWGLRFPIYAEAKSYA